MGKFLKKVRGFFGKKSSSWMWIFSAVGLLVVFVFGVAYSYHAGFQSEVNSFLWAKESGSGAVAVKIFHLPVTVVYNSASAEQKTKMEKLLANLVDPTVALKDTALQTTWLDAKTPEAQKLIAQSGLKYLPQIFVDVAIEKHPQFAKFTDYLTKAGGTYFIRLAPLEVLEAPVIKENDHFKNDPATAKVTIFAYESLLCDHCATEQKVFKDLLKLYGQKLAVVYRHFEPGDVNNAYAQGVECAGDQQKYFEMHDKLYADQAALLLELDKVKNDAEAAPILRKELEKSAKALNLKLKDFQACLDAGTHKIVVENQTVDALNYGVNAPPAFFINKNFRLGLQSFDDLKNIIDAELKRLK